MRLTLPIKRKPPENAEIFLEALKESADTYKKGNNPRRGGSGNRDILHRKKTDVGSGKLSGQIPGSRFNR